jgi:hypothetical protein
LTASLSGSGDTSTVSYIRASDPPEISTFSFVNHSNVTKYPDGGSTSWSASAAAQTAFKSGDIIKVSGTCDAHATSVQFTSYDSSLSTTQTLSVSGGAFSGNLTAGSKGYDTQGYFNMKCLQSGYANGPSITSQSKAGYITMNNTSPAFTTPSYVYDNGVALRKTQDCTVSCTASNTYSALYKYTCEQGTDVAVQGGDTTYAAIKTWDHNLAYEKWWDSTDANNAKVKVYNQANGLESSKDFKIEMEINAQFAMAFNGDGYPGSQYCLGDGDAFKCFGDPGASTNVTHVRFASQSNSGRVHSAASSEVAISSGSWSLEHVARSSGLGGSFSAVEAHAYLEVKIGGS